MPGSVVLNEFVGTGKDPQTRTRDIFTGGWAAQLPAQGKIRCGPFYSTTTRSISSIAVVFFVDERK
jgi:hypothetical protein